jgi:hypothetical protein
MGSVREWMAAFLCPSWATLAPCTDKRVGLLPHTGPMTFRGLLACLSLIDTGSASGKETIEPEGKAAKPADSGAVVGKGAKMRGLPEGRRSGAVGARLVVRVACFALEPWRFLREQARSHNGVALGWVSGLTQSLVARELAPAGLRSRPLHFFRQTALAGFATAAQSSGSKLPRHGGGADQTAFTSFVATCPSVIDNPSANH